jgi:hypothetical protein
MRETSRRLRVHSWPVRALLGAPFVAITASFLALVVFRAGDGAYQSQLPDGLMAREARIPHPSGMAVPGARNGDRIVIPKANVDAPLTVSHFDGVSGILQTPDGPDDVLFYDFADPWVGGYPGFGGNSIFGGHLDYGEGPCDFGKTPPPCPAVFWELNRLREGDLIEIRVQDNAYRYAVTRMFEMDANSDASEWQWIFYPTEVEAVTLITCAGRFDPTTREYSHRLVVRATRIS